jgi:hypothetical protein
MPFVPLSQQADSAFTPLDRRVTMNWIFETYSNVYMTAMTGLANPNRTNHRPAHVPGQPGQDRNGRRW